MADWQILYLSDTQNNAGNCQTTSRRERGIVSHTLRRFGMGLIPVSLVNAEVSVP